MLAKSQLERVARVAWNVLQGSGVHHETCPVFLYEMVAAWYSWSQVLKLMSRPNLI